VIDTLNRYDVAIVRHDFGLYGGSDGEDVLGVVEALATPVIAVLHAVPALSTGHRRDVLQRVIDSATAVVGLCRADAVTLRNHYCIDAGRLWVIPRGAAAIGPRHPRHRPEAPGTPTILTWGLIGPGKGIEHVVSAMALLRDLDPVPRT
jgi:hypothetical protein